MPIPEHLVAEMPHIMPDGDAAVPRLVNPTCRHCVWYDWRKPHGTHAAECRRYPPQNGAWPTVAEDQWCGELRQRGTGRGPLDQIQQ